MEINPLFMVRALQLARNGELDASPNPMVGAVIVGPDGNIAGEGWHRRCGEGHAEVNAVNSVRNKAVLAAATMYVTLEPCSHYGRTPPCAELIIRCGIPRVVVGTLDPFVKVAGRGVEMLRQAGVEVAVGVMEKECRELNRKFMTAHSLQRPYITLKWAQSADGFIDGHISTPLNSMLVHKLRATHDAILIGSGTALADNPTLTTRFYAGKSPVKVVLDRRKRLPADLRLFSDGDVIVIDGEMTLAEAMHTLYNKGISSVLVEGGAQIMESFAKDNLWDEIRVEVSPEHIEGKIKAPSLPKTDTIPDIRVVDGHKIISYKK
ncbi:MAG TPA: bifunctional diaminohydroxyphosphoribosylaminopyrimidine deaminase/5-amino-6-(5-phosphoribosylamino)uracil reductase RibD [Porphyromonadaceae bacterium]|nr:bifunctional diaminohydroxyphosphoribosylaminopyrimidine deaminase/5-amino-6-(5-phosphoribosylamino)uracil reductase RibD [Porphyromonadaceae bacterium]